MRSGVALGGLAVVDVVAVGEVLAHGFGRVLGTQGAWLRGFCSFLGRGGGR